MRDGVNFNHRSLHHMFFFFKCKFSNIFFKNSTNFMLTKLITAICKMFFLTHKKIKFLSQFSVKISNFDIHTF